jgi:hypothetical protein
LSPGIDLQPGGISSEESIPGFYKVHKYELAFWLAETIIYSIPLKLKEALHCEKSLFVLASHQKIPVLRTENSAVDTRTICLPPIEFF